MNYLYEKSCKYALIVGMKVLEGLFYVNTALLYVYNNNIIAKQLTDITSYYIDMLWCDYHNVKCNMPASVNWYGISCLVKNTQTNEMNSIIRKIPIQQCYYMYFFKQLIFMQDGRHLISDDEYTIKQIQTDNDVDNCVSNVGYMLDDISQIGDIKDSVLFLEYFNVFVVRYAMLSNMDSPKISQFVKCDVAFLSIEYTHPKMENSIFFELDTRFYVLHNELFSQSFIKYLLEHQIIDYIFDNDYKLNIMDENMDIQQLTSKQYIRLLNDKYEIIEIDTE